MCRLDVLFALFIFGEYVSASFLPADFNCWFSQGSVVAKDWLYIDAGEIRVSNESNSRRVNFTLSIDLRTSWTTSDVSPVVTPQTTGTRMQARNPTMWYDSINDWVYLYGGEPYAENKTNFPTVWGFPIENEGNVKWQAKYTAGIGRISEQDKSFSGFTELCSSSYATTATAYYSLGGYISYANDPAVTGIGGYRPAISGLVKYDFQNQTWSNSSTVGMAGYEEGFSVVGQGVFVPIFGQDGIIIFLGGDSPTSQDWKMASSLQPMSQITIFDVSSGQSYSQPATGTSIPISRVSFCAVGVGASDNSTWEIFMYGGKRTSSFNHPLDPKTLPDLSAIYILTLPAFEWFKTPVDVTNRLDHQCEVIGSRQMLIIGGIIENNVTHKDPWANGLGILDMTEVAWKTEYDPHAAPYTPSSIIKEHYQDSTKHYPKSWGNPALEFIFRASRNISNMAPNNTASPKASPKDTLADPTKVPSAANEPPEQKSTHSTPNTNTVVGVAIGSAIALIFCLIIVLWKKSAHARSFITKRLAFLHLSTPTPKHNSSVSNLTEPQLVEKDSFPIWEVDGKDRHLEMDAGFRAEMSGQHGVSEL